MRAREDCLVCILKQALNTARIATRNAARRREILNKIAVLLPGLRLDQTPAALSKDVYTITSEITGKRDPYLCLKKETNKAALRLLPSIRRMVRGAVDPLEAAVKAAIAGNIIDLGIGHTFDIRRDIRRIIDEPLTVSVLPRFRRELKRGRLCVYLGDNAGEIVFDSLLVEAMAEKGVRVIFVVKSGPIINDATVSDAKIGGLDRIADIIETGSDDIGINWRRVSPVFKKAVADADFLIAKGHGNFETCEDRHENFYFLLKAKCEVVASVLGVPLGSTVFTHISRTRRAFHKGRLLK